jgi:spermidine synthase
MMTIDDSKKYPIHIWIGRLAATFTWAVAGAGQLTAGVVFDAVSPYHHIRVVDDAGIRMLSFDGSRETRMSLLDPLKGHFQYTEYFHFAWLWKTNITRVLMLGLGGGSTQRAFLHFYPNVEVDSVEIDPVVVRIATNFFNVRTSDRHRIFVEDGRVFLQRTRQKYDAILLDAYVNHRYGSEIPQHLVTRQFIQLAQRHLNPAGVLAYNVITATRQGRVDIPMAVGRTLQSEFQQVYWFRCTDSLNAVLIATQNPVRWGPPALLDAAARLKAQGMSPPPGLFEGIGKFQTQAPTGIALAPILTDDYAPLEALDRRK